jgi:ammonium transporter, Amt family
MPASYRVAAFACATTLGILTAAPAFAQAGKIDGADTAFMMVATAIVLMMTIPGLALSYAGTVRKKNVLATMAQSLAATALVSILWIAFGYSLAFTGDGAWLGSADRLFLRGLGMDSISALAKSIPEALFMV